MDHLCAIFIFTKDRPVSLTQTLYSLKEENIKKYVIDDSFYLSNQLENLAITNSHPNTQYYKKIEFKDYLETSNIVLTDFDFQIQELGNKNWNLGNARNSALVLAKYNGIENALFIDDDIKVYNPTLISESFKLLKNYQFVGAKITGMPDNSIIGHISNELGIIDPSERMLSGGFLAFNPQKIKTPFTNIYNEDWIWMLIQLKNNEYKEYGEVLQATFDPYLNYKEKVIFQEFGEIVNHGLFEIRKNGSIDLLSENGFWNDVINKRKKKLSMLNEQTINLNDDRFHRIIIWLEINYFHFEQISFKNFFKLYFEQIQHFRALMKCNIF